MWKPSPSVCSPLNPRAAMTTVPPPNVALPQVLAAAAAAPTIVIPQPPAAIAALPVGTTIEAVVLPAPAASAPGVSPPPGPATPAPPAAILHTSLGDIAARLPIALPERAQVDLEIVRATPQQVTVKITTVDGSATAQYLAQTRAPTPAATPAVAVPQPQTQILPGPQPLPLGATWMPSGPAPFVQAGTISAIITQAPVPEQNPTGPSPPAQTPTAPANAAPSSPQAPPPPTLATLPLGSGSELSLKIVSVQLPGAPAVSAPPVANVQPPAPQAQSTAAAPLPPPMAPAPAGSVLASPPPQPGLVFAAAQPRPLPTPPALVQPSPPLATVTGTVVAAPDAIPTVEIEDRQVQLNVRANLPVGTKLVFEVMSATPPRAADLAVTIAQPAATAPMSGPPGAYTGWATLSESLAVLQRTDPIAAQQLSQVIPDGGPRTAAAIISFVQSMRTGDARQWPGDTTLRALEKAGPRGAHLAATLSGEVSELSARARDGGAEWRAIPIPWNAGGQIDRIALITRREGDSDADGAGGGKKGGGTRFLIDLNLSRLGPMQLDGMFKAPAKTFDMVLRTKEALPEDMRRDLIGLFTASNGAMGLAGGLTFQVTKKFADPLKAGNPADKGGLWA